MTMASTFISYSGSETHTRSDPSVTSIPIKAFWGNKKLVEVMLPDSIQVIGRDAFGVCSSLKRIHLCEGLRTIGECAFFGCKSLSQVIIPSTVITIDHSAFYRCTSLETVHLRDGLQTIGEAAFFYCTSLSQVSIPSSVITIDHSAFNNCTSLETVHLRDGLQTIDKGAFYKCKSLKRVTIPSTVVTIDYKVFSGCSSLKDVQFYEGLRTIGGEAFYDCLSLSQVSIPSSVSTIDYLAFNNCTSLETVHFRDGLQTIGNGAFYNCKLLKRVTIPSTVVTIDYWAFSGCSSLKDVQFYEGLRTIGGEAFCDCLSLMRIEIPSNVIFMDGPGQFQHCPILRNVVIPPSSMLGDEEFLLLFPTFQDVDCTFDMLKSRFDNLPLHKLCYNHSHQLMESNNRGMLADFLKSDCLGMTPLHVLACSGKHDLSLFCRIIEICPNSLIAKDKWGETPLGYVILSGAPKEVIHYFLNACKRYDITPDGFLDIIKRLVMFASREYLRGVIDAQRKCFPDLIVDWESVGEDTLHDLRSRTKTQP
jgi:hypothetical protein